MRAKKWPMEFLSAVLLVAAGVCVLAGPVGILKDWSNGWNKTPGIISDDGLAGYDSYLIGGPSAGSFPICQLNEYFDANFCSVNGADMMSAEQICRQLLEDAAVKNLVLTVCVDDGSAFDGKTDVRPEASFDAFDDAEPIGAVEDYLAGHPALAENACRRCSMDQTEACMRSVAAIRNMCAAAGVNFMTVAVPVYIEHFNDFDRAEVEQFYTALAETTPFWDFSVSSVSYEPRYFCDETHCRTAVGRMALARIFGDETVYVPGDFGVRVTTDNVAEVLETYWAGALLTEMDYTARVPVLMYHHLAETGNDSMRVSVARFEEQIRALYEAGYTAVSFEELQAYVMEGAPLPDKPVCITFDDGYLSNYELAYPILKQYGMKATIFVIGVSVGKEQYKDTSYDMTPHFSWEQAREMMDSGLISIQSHTWDMHQWAPFEAGDAPQENILRHEGVDEEDYIQALTRDCERMAEQFSAHLGYVPTVLAYPGGYYDTLSQAVLDQNGYAVTLSTRHGSNTVVQGLPQTLYAMKRFTMNDAVTVETLLDWVSAARGS